MKTKRILFLFTIICLLLLTVACGHAEEDDEPETLEGKWVIHERIDKSGKKYKGKKLAYESFDIQGNTALYFCNEEIFGKKPLLNLEVVETGELEYDFKLNERMVFVHAKIEGKYLIYDIDGSVYKFKKKKSEVTTVATSTEQLTEKSTEASKSDFDITNANQEDSSGIKKSSQTDASASSDTSDNRIIIGELEQDDMKFEYWISSEIENVDPNSRYWGDTYVFKRADPELYEGGSLILNVYEDSYYDPETDAYYAGKYADAGYQALFVGQVFAMFGMPDYMSADLENLLSYTVSAEDPEGNVIYLEVYFGPSGPAIGGEPNDPIYAQAAEELADRIRRFTPIEYSYDCIYPDLDARTHLYVKDGVGYYDW